MKEFLPALAQACQHLHGNEFTFRKSTGVVFLEVVQIHFCQELFLITGSTEQRCLTKLNILYKHNYISISKNETCKMTAEQLHGGKNQSYTINSEQPQRDAQPHRHTTRQKNTNSHRFSGVPCAVVKPSIPVKHCSITESGWTQTGKIYCLETPCCQKYSPTHPNN